VNHKRTHRFYVDEGLSVREKKHRKRPSHFRGVPPLPSAANKRWCMDFVHDSLHKDRHIWMLTVVDVFTRECLAVHVDFALNARKLIWGARTDRPVPTVASDDHRRQRLGVHLARDGRLGLPARRRARLHPPGRPLENAFIESFSGRPRDECLNVEVFLSLDDARRELPELKTDYNECRPHGSLGDLPRRSSQPRSDRNPQPEARFLNQEMAQPKGSGQA